MEFYKPEIPDINSQHVGTSRNIGVVYIEAGKITKKELAKEFSTIYETSWPWQIRQLDDYTFLVKFPPEISVDREAHYPCFGLSIEGLTVNIETWVGELDHVEELQEVSLQLRGLKPYWCEWSILDQIVYVFGPMVDVDWQGLFHNLAEVVRVKILCRDHTLIPKFRMFGKKWKIFKTDVVSH